MGEINGSWRSQTVTIKGGETTTVNFGFVDVPNIFIVANYNNSSFFGGIEKIPNSKKYEYKIKANSMSIMARPLPSANVYFYNKNAEDLTVTLYYMRGEYDPLTVLSNDGQVIDTADGVKDIAEFVSNLSTDPNYKALRVRDVHSGLISNDLRYLLKKINGTVVDDGASKNIYTLINNGNLYTNRIKKILDGTLDDNGSDTKNFYKLISSFSTVTDNDLKLLIKKINGTTDDDGATSGKNLLSQLQRISKKLTGSDADNGSNVNNVSYKIGQVNTELGRLFNLISHIKEVISPVDSYSKIAGYRLNLKALETAPAQLPPNFVPNKIVVNCLTEGKYGTIYVSEEGINSDSLICDVSYGTNEFMFKSIAVTNNSHLNVMISSTGGQGTFGDSDYVYFWGYHQFF